MCCELLGLCVRFDDFSTKLVGSSAVRAPFIN